MKIEVDLYQLHPLAAAGRTTSPDLTRSRGQSREEMLDATRQL